jgi:hypothetical protein
MFYQSLDEAIFGEGTNSRDELIDKLSSRFSTHSSMNDERLIELANQYREEKIPQYPHQLIANDPIEW